MKIGMREATLVLLVAFGVIGTPVLGAPMFHHAGGEIEILSRDPKVWEENEGDPVRDGLLQEGAYRGFTNDNEKMDLLVQPMGGREGSYLALLLKNGRYFTDANLYVIDPYQGSRFVMTPVVVTEDGEIGMRNNNPSLVLDVVSSEGGRASFMIRSAGSSNPNGFQGTVDFTHRKKSNIQWLPYREGTYQIFRVRNAATLYVLPEGERQTNASINLDGGGDFLIREKLPRIFVLHRNSIVASGERLAEAPSAIGVFLKEGRRSEYLLLINPADSKNILTFARD